MNEHKKRKYKLPGIFIGIVAISVALGAVLVLDMGNISGGFTPQNLKLANVNYDKYGVVATIIISMGGVHYYIFGARFFKRTKVSR